MSDKITYRKNGVPISDPSSEGVPSISAESAPADATHAGSSQPPRTEMSAVQIANLAMPSRRVMILRFGRKAWSFVVAVGSWMVTRDMQRARYVKRIEACLACPHRTRTGIVGHCGKCGCGRNKLSELSVKAAMRAAKCPENKWE